MNRFSWAAKLSLHRGVPVLFEALLVLALTPLGLEAGAGDLRARVNSGLSTLSDIGKSEAGPAPPPHFSLTARAVSNWRSEAGAFLVPISLALVAKHSESDPTFVARCVKLNNYWCIKQARWAGELGGDAEGHTGFATAAEGADAAALLLRRYYREYGRRNALAIVRRWAPAECATVASSSLPRVSAPPAQKVSAGLAPRGLGNTVRARFLARRAPGGAPRRLAAAQLGSNAGLRVQPWSARARLAGRPSQGGRARIAALPPLRPVADIAAGIGAGGSATSIQSNGAIGNDVRATIDRPLRVSVRPSSSPGAFNPSALLAADRLVAESAALPSLVAGLPKGSLLDLRVPAPFCSNDETRIRNYANRIAGSVGLKAEDDLRLFETDGAPTARLAPVMLAMSAVELGALRAAPSLIASAIARLEKRVTGAAASAD